MKTIEDIENAAIAAGCWAIPGVRYPRSEDHNAGVIRLVREAVEAEREACAKVCEESNDGFARENLGRDKYQTPGDCASAIRKRSAGQPVVAQKPMWGAASCPIGTMATPEYRAEQAQKNADAQALLETVLGYDMQKEMRNQRAARMRMRAEMEAVGLKLVDDDATPEPDTDRLMLLLAHAVKEADGWHDDSYGGPIEDDPLMDEARALIASVPASPALSREERTGIRGSDYPYNGNFYAKSPIGTVPPAPTLECLRKASAELIANATSPLLPAAPPASPLESALANGEEATGLCTVRDAVQFMFEKKADVTEMYFQHAGKEWNVELRILKVEDSKCTG